MIKRKIEELKEEIYDDITILDLDLTYLHRKLNKLWHKAYVLLHADSEK